ncbi:MAG: AlpA family phage regulatory protein [Alphaproteobacteria bacterium]|nr:AlpA family phage regulatory protein [Alphaproteobacteria bacterium]
MPLDNGLLRERDVVRATGLSRTTLWRLRQSGDFPRPVQITCRRVGWPAGDVEAWIEARSHGERRPA